MPKKSLKKDGSFKLLILNAMVKHPQVLGAVIALFATILWWLLTGGIYAFVSTNPKSPAPVFPMNGPVNDIYNGSLETLRKELQKHSLRFVAFYAPWCAQSRKMMPEFVDAARQLRSEASFIAINCWIGSCRKNFTLLEFPKLYAYHTKYSAVEYLEPPEAWRMVRFLRSVMRPFHYLGNRKDVDGFLQANEVVVIGYFNIQKKKDKRFSIFLSVCISSTNIVSQVLFGAITSGGLASSLGLQKVGNILLHQVIGKTITYPENANFTIDALLKWIYSNKIEIVTQLTPNMTHVEYYIRQLKKGPSLMLFLSFSPPHNQLSNCILEQYRRLAFEYKNCSCSKISKTKTDLKLSALPNDNVKDADCSRTFYNQPRGLCRSFAFPSNHNTCSVCQSCKTHCACFDLTASFTKSLHNLFSNVRPEVYNCNCLERTSYYHTDILSICCNKSTENSETSLFSSLMRNMRKKRDGLHNMATGKQLEQLFNQTLNNLISSMETLLNVSLKETTNKILDLKLKDNSHQMDNLKLLDLSASTVLKKERAKRKQPSVVPETTLKYEAMHCGDGSRRNFSSNDFSGLSCKTNRTVNFFYLDLDKYFKIAEGVGILLEQLRKPMAMALIDVKNEASYILNEKVDVSKETVVEFVTNFTNYNLERRSKSSKLNIEDHCNMEADGTSCITQVNSHTFKEIVLDDSKDVFLLYYAPWCGFCKRVFRPFLQLAYLYRKIPSLVFARINADENDLPFHYTVDGYPTFILYPAEGKSTSVRYPEDRKLELLDFIHFIEKFSSRQTKVYINKYKANHG